MRRHRNAHQFAMFWGLLTLCLLEGLAGEGGVMPLDAGNPLLTHWPDEFLMRTRLSTIADKRLQGHVHYNDMAWKGTNKLNREKRRKRDFGLLTSPLATAVVSGMTAKVVSDLTAFRSQPSQGGCEWFGTAPLCNFPCPSEYDYVRSHNGRCSSFWFSFTCKPDESFGETCSTVLGSFFKKRFCCKSDPNECTWSGRWMGANTAHNAYCRYDNSIGRCGGLTCSINHHEFKITGEHCDELYLFNMTGSATCGFIAWSDTVGTTVNSWYKTR